MKQNRKGELHEDFQLLIIIVKQDHNLDHTSILHSNRQCTHRSSGQSLCVVRGTYNSKISHSICVIHNILVS